jgi:hypothetical protein
VIRGEGFADSGLFRIGRGRNAAVAYAVALGLIPLVTLASTMLGIGAGVFALRWEVDGGLTSPNVIVSWVTGQFGLAGLVLSLSTR